MNCNWLESKFKGERKRTIKRIVIAKILGLILFMIKVDTILKIL